MPFKIIPTKERNSVNGKAAMVIVVVVLLECSSGILMPLVALISWIEEEMAIFEPKNAINQSL